MRREWLDNMTSSACRLRAICPMCHTESAPRAPKMRENPATPASARGCGRTVEESDVPHTSAIQRCSVQRANGTFCDTPSAPDVPFPICAHHAMRLWKHISEEMKHAEADLPRMTELAFKDLDDRRERKAAADAAKEFVVYYVLVGDLLKIGTTGNLKQRLGAYPPHKKLLATEPGTFREERMRHIQFADLLASGNEWFRFEGLLVEHVKRLRRTAERAA